MDFFRLLKKIWRAMQSPPPPLSYTEQSALFVERLRRSGIRVGDNCMFWAVDSHLIDRTRPELVIIGSKVRVTTLKIG